MNLIVAVDNRWGIGRDGGLLASIPTDMKYFKEHTTGKVVVMGRKTLESMPHKRGLPNRINYVLTSNPDFEAERCKTVNSEDELWQELSQYEPDDVFLIGGATLYNRFYKLCDKLYVTKMDADLDADTFITCFDDDPDFRVVSESEPITENGITFRFVVYQKKEDLDYFELTLGKRQGEFTVADRDALPDDIRTELIDGYIYYLAAPNRKHQIIAGMIYADLLTCAFGSKNECLPQIAPVDVNLDDDDKTMLQPDVLVLCHEDRDERYVHGAPEFVAEIISKYSRKTDTIIKLNKYMNAGVREYWIVDPYNETVTVYDFGSDIFPTHYTFDDAVPVGISGGECSIDFRRIKDVLIRQFGSEKAE